MNKSFDKATSDMATAKQLEALQHVKDGLVTYKNYGYGAWRIGGPSNPSVVGKLISNGWAKWLNQKEGKCAFLTHEGEVVLEQHKTTK